jgi:hypothetical protein
MKQVTKLRKALSARKASCCTAKELSASNFASQAPGFTVCGVERESSTVTDSQMHSKVLHFHVPSCLYGVVGMHRDRENGRKVLHDIYIFYFLSSGVGGLDPCGLGYGPVVDFCEHGSEFRIP